MDAINYLLEPFGYSFMVRALAISLIISILCPSIGIFVITRGYGFMGDALAHSIFPGMVAALILGISPWIGAWPSAIAFALIVGYLIRHTGIRADTAIAIMFATMFALGIILISIFSSHVAIDLDGLLIGQILGVSESDIVATIIAAIIVLTIVFGFYKELVFTSFDATGAEVAGIPTAFINYMLLAVIATVIMVTVKAVGIILVLAMLVAPSAAAALIAQRHVNIIFLGIAIALVASISGIYLAYYLDLPAGPAMALVSGVIFGGTALLRRRLS